MTTIRSVTLGYHGHCFDGMASAAVLTHLLRALEGSSLEFRYRGLDHQPGGSHVPPGVLDGDINGVVDFRYTTSPALTWYFDHHVSGIVGDTEQRDFDARAGAGRFFFDPGYGSCCALIADVARDRFSVDMGALEELIRWADTIDAARFESAERAVRLDAPALELMAVVEAHGSERFLAPRIARLARGEALADVAADPEVKGLLGPLLSGREKAIRAIRETARVEGGVACFDLTLEGALVERYPKFAPYWLFPECRYSVGVTKGSRRAKVSVGANPWAKEPRSHDIAALCAAHGGGGHPFVGAVSLEAGAVAEAQRVAQEIARALREPGRPQSADRQ